MNPLLKNAVVSIQLGLAEALWRLRATFAHPNAYPQTNYGAVAAGQLSNK